MKTETLIKLLCAGLFVSLCANMFLGGMVLGHHNPMQHGLHQPPPRHALEKKLSADDRTIVHDEMQKRHGELKLLRKKLDEHRKKIGEAAEANDTEALDSVLKAEKETKTAILTLIQESRAAALERMSPEGRDTLQKMVDDNRARVRLWQTASGPMPDLPPDLDLGGPDDMDMP